MTDAIERALNRLGEQLPGCLSNPGSGRYAGATAIWAKPIGQLPRAIRASGRLPELPSQEGQRSCCKGLRPQRRTVDQSEAALRPDKHVLFGYSAAVAGSGHNAR